jgi:hypothetical protein
MSSVASAASAASAALAPSARLRRIPRVPGFNHHNRTFTPKPDDGICMWSYNRFEWVKMPSDGKMMYAWNQRLECFIAKPDDVGINKWDLNKQCWCNGDGFNYNRYLQGLSVENDDCQSRGATEKDAKDYLEYLMDFYKSEQVQSYHEFCIEGITLQDCYDDEAYTLAKQEKKQEGRSLPPSLW